MEGSAGNPRAASSHKLPAWGSELAETSEENRKTGQIDSSVRQSPEENQGSAQNPDQLTFSKDFIKQDPDQRGPESTAKQDQPNEDLFCTDQEKPGPPSCPKRELKPEESQQNQIQRPDEDTTRPSKRDKPPSSKHLPIFTSTLRHELNTEHPPPHLNAELTPPHLSTEKTPPPHLSTEKTPPPPSTEKTPPPQLNTELTPPPHHLKPEKTPPQLNAELTPPHLSTEKTPPPPYLDTEQTPPPPSTEQTPPPPSTELTPPPPSIEQTPPPPPSPEHPPPPSPEQTPPPHLNTEQTPPPPSTEQTPPPPSTEHPPPPPSTEHPPPHLNTEQTPPPPSTEQTPPPHLNTEQTPPPPSPEQTPPPHLNTEQTPPPPSTEQTLPPPSTEHPPPHLNTEQTPPPPPSTEQTPPPHLNTEQTPPPPSTKQTPPPPSTEHPPPHLNTEQTPPPHLNTEQTPPHLSTEQTPPPTHLNSEQIPPQPLLNTDKRPLPPPPPHQSTEQAPPSPADQQSPLPSLSTVNATNVSTLAPPAPPLTIEVFCEQVQPGTPASSSGEPKLCGFLEKQGGPLRAWKQRWFTYEEKKNQLFYFCTRQDVMPLGQVDLSSATFTYPLNAERGTFHIRTPERTFILKAVTQDLMLYWLQQLQVKRWQHRQMSICPDPTNNNKIEDDFLPVLKSPVGLVGEDAVNASSQQTPFTRMSIKHPLIRIHNSFHSLRKRSSQDGSQSMFHVETPSYTHLSSSNTTTKTVPAASRTPSEPQTPPPALSLAEPTGQVSPVMHRAESRSRRRNTRSSSSMMVLLKDTVMSDRMSRFLQEKQMLMEEVKAQKELVWILHKALEASQLEKRTCAEFLAATGEQERLELLRHRERQVAELRAQLEKAREEAELAQRSEAQSKAQVVELQEHIRLLEEKNTAGKEVIIKLSDKLTDCMLDPPPSCEEDLDFQTLKQQIENLKDDLEAYQTQNRFLNSEIQQLTRLWRTSSEQEKTLMVKCALLEAGNCQVESRYLNVLRQLQEVKSLDPVQREAVQKMIEEALKGEVMSVREPSLARDHDEYGFKIIPDYEVEDMKLLAKIQALEIRSNNLMHQEGVERPLLARWAQFLAGRLDNDLFPSPELKGLLRAGIPQVYRQQVWRWLVQARTRNIREHHPQRYQQLCEKSRMSPHPACRQIQLDLHRTLTTNNHFSSPSSPALQQLRHILLAFSWQNPAIGYCQGLNRLAAIALLVLQSEEDAFWCLVAVVETIMPQDYYTKNLVASQADQRVLKDLLLEKLPRLAAHFEDYSIDVSLMTFNWFLVVFVESLPSDILLPLWDAFLYEGTKVIFRYALAIFKYKEDDILKICDSVEIYQYLRFFTKTISDSRKLINIAFSVMNPFPGRLLRNKRAFHLERLQGELQELEEQQRQFVTESAVHKELDAAASEDEEL
ncbi:TBC1 domain family member 2A [Labrus bergylta]|uniref:TBC1 domain family member 2A n=1 Tax=Labrus bergylta TaxID=56723 RepID=UPI003313DBE9